MASQRSEGYLPIENYGIIGNMHTCALVGIDGSIDFMCWPDFDSPSVFCRLLDADKGGYWSIAPAPGTAATTKQQYLPSSNLLSTRYIHADGVASVTDFFPRPKTAAVVSRAPRPVQTGQTVQTGQGQAAPKVKTVRTVQEELKKWLVRRIEGVRGTLTLDIELCPAFDYARASHVTRIELDEVSGASGASRAASFWSDDVQLQLDVVVDGAPVVRLAKLTKPGMQGEGVFARVTVAEGESVSLVLRRDDRDPGLGRPPPAHHMTPVISTAVLDAQQHDTHQFWYQWVRRSRFKGRWRQTVDRSLMVLKLLTYEPTGAIVAAPTFSVPEAVGGARNWDYRYSWVRDASFTVYILLRLGFRQEADAYMGFVSRHVLTALDASPGGRGLPIMFTIHGSTDIPELELDHLAGYRGSRPVRIGNAAAFHQQFDIYGELLDAVYLHNKYGTPTTWDQWVAVRRVLDYALALRGQPDMSIWEVRNRPQRFVYSQIMLWVAFDRGLRLADKRNLPCPNRAAWLAARDGLYEDVMRCGFNEQLRSFVQSYETPTVLDSSILIAPLVFFIAPSDPRFLDTLDRILLPPEHGGLTSSGLVSRYDTALADDGVGGEEGTFTMCTFWLVEAMARASVYAPQYLPQAVGLFENVLAFGNHLRMFSEEISASGQQLGNTPQAFSHLALISAAFHLDKVAEQHESEQIE